MKTTELKPEDLNRASEFKGSYSSSKGDQQSRSSNQRSKHSTQSYVDRFSKPLAASSLFPTPDLFPILDTPLETLEESSESKDSKDLKALQDEDGSEDTQSVTYTLPEDSHSVNFGDVREYNTEKKRPGKKNSSSSELGLVIEPKRLPDKGGFPFKCGSPGIANPSVSHNLDQALGGTSLKLFEHSASKNVEADMLSCLSSLQMILDHDKATKQSKIVYPSLEALLADPEHGPKGVTPALAYNRICQNQSLKRAGLSKAEESLALRMMKNRRNMFKSDFTLELALNS